MIRASYGREIKPPNEIGAAKVNQNAKNIEARETAPT